MAKSKITSSDIKNVVLKLWNENDIEIERTMFGKPTMVSAKERLNIDFYCFRKNVSTAHALIKVLKDEPIAMLPQAVDYCEKRAIVVFVVEDEKSEILDSYVQNLRAKYLGLPLNIEIDGLKIKYIDFGTLQYDKPPETTGIGRAIVYSMELKLTYTTNVAVSGDKVWLLEGVELPYLSENVDLDKQGSTNNIYGARSTQSLPSTQSKYYRFTLPFNTDNEICRQLQKDILDGDMSKIYTLTYYDGISYMQDNPFTVKVTLFRTSRSSAPSTKTSEFEVTFAESSDESKWRVKYEMALIDNPFDSGTVNTRYFNDRAEQQEWFSEKINSTGAPYSVIKAPNINSLSITQQTYFAPPSAKLDSLLTKNYAIIKATEGESVKYYYYFIQSASVGADNQILVDLRMDSIQTYYFDPNIDIAPCTINRAHLNRWVDNGDGTVSFDGSPESLLFKRENYQNLATRLIKRTPLYFCVDKNSKYDEKGDFVLSPLDQWLKDNVKHWVYVYCVPAENKDKELSLHIKGAGTGLVCFCYPVYKEERIGKKFAYLTAAKNILSGESRSPEVWSAAFWAWVGFNDVYTNYDYYPKTAHVVSVKHSVRPPMDYIEYALDLEDSSGNPIRNYENGYYINKDGALEIDTPHAATWGNESDGNIGKGLGGFITSFGRSENRYFHTFFIQLKSNTDYHPSPVYKISKDFTFQKYSVKIFQEQYKLKYNPKLLSSDFYQLSLEGFDGQRFDYDAQKLNRKNLRFKYTEALGIDITRGYLRAESTKTDIYGEYADSNFTGLVYSADNSLPFLQDSYANFISNNKNFFLQAQMQKDYGKRQAALGAVSSIAGSAVGAAGGDLSSLGNLGISAGNAMMAFEGVNMSHRMQMLSIDNIKAAPDSVRNASGNAFFIGSVTGQQLFLCEYEALNDEMQEANEDMYLNGYTCNRWSNVKLISNTRKHFTFVQAEIQNIDGISLSSEARNDIRARFARGIRFCNVDKLSYNLANYERWLDD